MPIAAVHKRRRNLNLWLPSLLTTFSLMCGIIAILLAIENYWGNPSAGPQAYALSAWLLLTAMVFDYMDGKIARLTNAVSDFGLKIDSLTDYVSFGIAPVVVVYAALLHEISIWILAPVFFIYIFAGAWRLARFNCNATTASPYYFTGLPIPAASAFLCTVILSATDPSESVVPKILGRFVTVLPPQVIEILVLGLMIVLAGLMVSRIPFPAFKQINRTNMVILIGVTLFFGVLSFILPLGNIMFLIMLLYIFIGIFQYFLNQVVRLHKRAELKRR